MKEITSVKEVQEIILDMLTYLDEVCNKYGIKYFVCDGTLLGAIRHKGFIPWDDDIDVWIPREDYDRLEKVINEQENSHFRVLNFRNKKDYVYGYAKLIDTRTKLVEDVGYSGEMGIYLDLFPYDGLPGRTEQDFAKHVKKCLFLELQRAPAFRNYKLYRKQPAEHRGPKKFLRQLLRWMIGGKRILRILDGWCRKYPVKGSAYVGCLCGGYKDYQMMPKEVVEDVVRVPFEDRTVNAPAGYETYLTKLYGDYMQLPPKEKQVSHHFFKAWWVEEEEKKCQK